MSVSCARLLRLRLCGGGDVSRVSVGGDTVVIWAAESRRPGPNLRNGKISKWKYWNRPKIENQNGASEKTFSNTYTFTQNHFLNKQMPQIRANTIEGHPRHAKKEYHRRLPIPKLRRARGPKALKRSYTISSNDSSCLLQRKIQVASGQPTSEN
ncbi:unnamed protein product [Nesidiocoris tenuis]|uniref:Uncharacterized protein n=1 Tax=Nesidiocoris tenuis TaxID=355587 RepID=A0A6H5HFQ4_9HEMI|nr:unnamed protein product [Nesidiocoris tenuis]